MATVVADCCFLSAHIRRGVRPSVGHETEKTRLLSAHADPISSIGLHNKWLEILRDLDAMGNWSSRSDHQAALRSLVSEVARLRGDAVTFLEHAALETQVAVQ